MSFKEHNLFRPFILRSVLIVFALWLFEGKVIAIGADENKIVRTYYVSASNGNDDNDGKSLRNPIQHIYAIKQKENVRIKLKSGDVFFEQVSGFSGSIIESYGKGSKPVLCGFKVLEDTDAWTFDDRIGCWKIDLTQRNAFSGISERNMVDEYINNIGFLYIPQEDKVIGHLVQKKTDLKDFGDFFVSSHFTRDSIDGETYKYLWLKSKKDPREYRSLCFSLPIIGVRAMFGCTIRNISVVGFNFGFTNCHHSIIENCQIDLIGGSVQIGYPKWVRYGNGIEFWGNAQYNIVRNCLISRTYDCGVTIQGAGDLRESPQSIHIYNNRFYHCRQAFEFWLNYSNNYKPEFIDCSFTKNLCYEMGENEFSSPEKRDAGLLCYDNNSKPIRIEDNVFWGSSYFCGMYYPQGIGNNDVYIYQGQYLSYYNANPVFFYTLSDIDKYKQQSGDNSTIHEIDFSNRQIMKKGEKLKKQLGWHKVDLHL